jgi:hypothetical protein
MAGVSMPRAAAQEATAQVTPAPAQPTPVIGPTTPPTPAPTAPPPISLEAAEALPSLVAARSDIELLATTALGAVRPAGWSGSLDVNDPQIALYLRLDLEILAGTVLGAENRPEGWFGVVPSVPLAVARDIRHDLELLADDVIGARTVRPAGWTGDDPLMRCDRPTQALAAVLAREGFTINADFTQPDVCRLVALEVSRFVERTIIQPPAAQVAAAAAEGETNTFANFQYTVDSPFVPAYYDRKARFPAGVLPINTGFDVLGRSTVEFSNMMLVTGDGFTLFVDYTTTPVTQGEFALLPDVGAGEPTTDCQPRWCE